MEHSAAMISFFHHRAPRLLNVELNYLHVPGSPANTVPSYDIKIQILQQDSLLQAGAEIWICVVWMFFDWLMDVYCYR